jgi:hypothetical protein
MPRGEKLLKFLAGLMVDRFYGSVTIKFEAGKVTHVEMETKRVWCYRELPEQVPEPSRTLHDGQTLDARSPGPLQ